MPGVSSSPGNCLRAWDMLQGMKGEPAPAPASDYPWPATLPRGKKVACGGVVLDPAGNVLVRELRNHYGGYVWNFAKGRSDPGLTPEQTALRETREGTGVEAIIVCPIPGELVGGTTINRYFLMQASAGPSAETPDCLETRSILWVTPEMSEGSLSSHSWPLRTSMAIQANDWCQDNFRRDPKIGANPR